MLWLLRQVSNKKFIEEQNEALKAELARLRASMKDQITSVTSQYKNEVKALKKYTRTHAHTHLAVAYTHSQGSHHLALPLTPPPFPYAAIRALPRTVTSVTGKHTDADMENARLRSENRALREANKEIPILRKENSRLEEQVRTVIQEVTSTRTKVTHLVMYTQKSSGRREEGEKGDCAPAVYVNL